MKFIHHSGSRNWQQVIKQKWWLNQQRAINCVENYLASNSDRQAMVRMPTGTGKTAVIATFAQLLADKPRCLVGAPWEYLVGQLQQELCERFWKKVDEDSNFTQAVRSIYAFNLFKCPESGTYSGRVAVHQPDVTGASERRFEVRRAAEARRSRCPVPDDPRQNDLNF